MIFQQIFIAVISIQFLYINSWIWRLSRMPQPGLTSISCFSVSLTIDSALLQYPCECGRNCESYYPCLLLYTRIDSVHADKTVSQWPVVLYDSDWQQIFVNNAKEDIRQRVCIFSQIITPIWLHYFRRNRPVSH